MRYTIEAYKTLGSELFRVIDTFDGNKCVASSLRDVEAITRRDELNQFKLDAPVQSHPVEISTRKFEAAHGKLPRGTGSWGFCPREFYDADNYLDHVMWYTGSYAVAKRRAVTYFRTRPNVFEVVVCS